MPEMFNKKEKNIFHLSFLFWFSILKKAIVKYYRSRWVDTDCLAGGQIWPTKITNHIQSLLATAHCLKYKQDSGLSLPSCSAAIYCLRVSFCCKSDEWSEIQPVIVWKITDVLTSKRRDEDCQLCASLWVVVVDPKKERTTGNSPLPLSHLLPPKERLALLSWFLNFPIDAMTRTV